MHNPFDTYSQTREMLDQRVDAVGEGLDAGVLKNILGMLDMTTLEGSDTVSKVESLCQQSRFSQLNAEFPDAAAVCVYPTLARAAKKALKGTGIRIAAVAGAFPSGQSSLQVKLEEIRWAINEGADEIDTVISRGKLLDGNDEEVFDELCAIREACGPILLKVILETGELPTVALVRRASELAILAGADFIKTSTGKIAPGAEPAPFLVMLDTIREYHLKTGKAVGIKAAGGVRSAGQAMLFAKLADTVLGEQWITRDYFRIGASSLASDILNELPVTK